MKVMIYYLPLGLKAIYFIKNNVLGHLVKFNGAVFDYFGKPAEPTQFNVKCIDCVSVVLSKVHFVVDNITSLGINFAGSNIENKLNVTVMLISALQSIKKINAILVVDYCHAQIILGTLTMQK